MTLSPEAIANLRRDQDRINREQIAKGALENPIDTRLRQFDSSNDIRSVGDAHIVREADVDVGSTHDPLANIRTAMLADLNAGPTAIDAATAPRWICHPVLPIAGANLAAPGGTGKTSLVLGEMVQVTCGHELYGAPVDLQGPCVLVTAEDGAAHARYILQQILRDGVDCGGLPDRAAERAKHDIRIVGWPRPQYGPIVLVDHLGGFHRAPVFDLLIELLQPISPVYVSLDPSVLFSPGERFGNDGDSFVASMMHDTALTIGACMQMTDHVAQSVARNGTVDQYAARGGTAKTDNARLARQLVSITRDAAGDMTLPLGVTSDEIAAGRILQLHTTKSNYAPRPPPIWLRRRRYWMEYLRTPTNEERTANASRQREQQTAADAAIVIEWVRQQLAVGDGIRYTRRDLDDSARPILPEGFPMPRKRVREAVGYALATGSLRPQELPTSERHGGRRAYLAPA